MRMDMGSGHKVQAQGMNASIGMSIESGRSVDMDSVDQTWVQT